MTSIEDVIFGPTLDGVGIYRRKKVAEPGKQSVVHQPV